MTEALFLGDTLSAPLSALAIVVYVKYFEADRKIHPENGNA